MLWIKFGKARIFAEERFMDNQKQNSNTSWIKAHHVNWIGWTIIVLGVMLAGCVLFWISRQ